MAHSDTTWVATVTKVMVEVCASGAGGKGNFNLSGREGGGAGAYSRKAGIVTIIGNGYLVRQGLKGIAGGGALQGDESLFIDGATVRAEGGTNSNAFLTGGTGGKAVNGTGDVKFDGGDGSSANIAITHGWGGGGPGTQAGNGQAAFSILGGLDALGAPGGGDGGASPDGAGQIPSEPGGGGGGGAGNGTVPSSGTGGDGADGWVRIFDDTVNNGQWPPGPSATVLYVVGSPPPPPAPPPSSSVKSAFVM